MAIQFSPMLPTCRGCWKGKAYDFRETYSYNIAW